MVFSLGKKGYQKGDEILINSIPRALAETDKGLLVSQYRLNQVWYQYDGCRRYGTSYQGNGNLSDVGQLSWLYSLMLLRTIHLWRVPSMVLGRQMLSSMSEFLVLVWVKRALEKVRGQSFDVVAETVKKTALKSLVSVNWLVKWPVRD